MPRCLVTVLTYNNGSDLRKTLSGFSSPFPFDVLVHVDGSTDGSDACCGDFPFRVLRVAPNQGVGASIRNVLRFAEREGYDAIAILPGNAKNDPAQIPRLLAPILEDRADYVQGSRFLPGGAFANTPPGRLVAIRIFSRFLSLLSGRRCTDALEGMRAYRVSLPRDMGIDLSGAWLDHYELETFLHFHVLRSRMRYVEIPVAKIYPADRRGLVTNRKGRRYSHIRPFVDWWRIVRPVLYVFLGCRR